MSTTQILIAGFGGQGVLFAGKLIAYKVSAGLKGAGVESLGAFGDMAHDSLSDDLFAEKTEQLVYRADGNDVCCKCLADNFGSSGEYGKEDYAFIAYTFGLFETCICQYHTALCKITGKLVERCLSQRQEEAGIGDFGKPDVTVADYSLRLAQTAACLRAVGLGLDGIDAGYNGSFGKDNACKDNTLTAGAAEAHFISLFHNYFPFCAIAMSIIF